MPSSTPGIAYSPSGVSSLATRRGKLTLLLLHQDHLDIVAALHARDANAAAEALTRHLRRTVEFVSEHLPVAVAPVP